MVEMAFKVNPGTTFYKNYFATKEEKAHFIEIAKQFFDKYFPDEKLSYVLNDRLTVDLKPELLAKYESQVMKRRDPHGFVVMNREISTDIIPANMQLAAPRFQTPLHRLN